jgi:hypothetical protein
MRHNVLAAFNNLSWREFGDMSCLSCSERDVFRKNIKWVLLILILTFGTVPVFVAQQLNGGLVGTVQDPTGSVVAGAKVLVVNTATNLKFTAETSWNGSYQVPEIPAGTYTVTFSLSGFKSELHSAIIVEGNRTTTVDGKLQVGSLESTVEVTDTPLLNKVDTTTGYVLESEAINNTPLGTGSFTQLAILAPGVNADFLNTSGTNAGLGNQAIWSNGQRDTSNSFSVNA